MNCESVGCFVLHFLLPVSIFNSQLNHNTRKEVFISVWEGGPSNKVSTILIIVSFEIHDFYLKLIWNSLNLLIAQYNTTVILKKKTLYFPIAQYDKQSILSSGTCTMVLTHVMVFRSCDLGPLVSRSSDHTL